MHPHIAILPSTGVAYALWVDSDRVQRSEVSLYTPNLILEDLVVEACLEFPLPR